VKLKAKCQPGSEKKLISECKHIQLELSGQSIGKMRDWRRKTASEDYISFLKLSRNIRVVAYTFLLSDGRNERGEIRGTQ